MIKYVVTVSANTDYYVADVNKKRDFYERFDAFLSYGARGRP